MRTTFIAALALVAVFATSSAGVAQKPTPPGKAEVTLTADQNPVRFSTPLVLKTSVKGARAGLSVKLQRRKVDGTYVDLATAATNDKGDVSFTRRPSRNTTFRTITVETTPRASADLLVKVAPLVGFIVSDTTPRKGARIVFRGTVRPAHDGRRVRIQRKQADGSWLTVASPRLRDAGSRFSKYSRRLTIRETATYRVVLPEHADHAEGVSRERTLTVG